MKAAPLRPLVVTGASGFVGRAVVDRLRASHDPATVPTRAVTLVVRNPGSLAPLHPLPDGWRVVRCDLAHEALPAGTIAPGSVVLHLAAATGTSAPATMRAVNVDGTRRVVEAAVAAGGTHVVFVSSIAASFADRRWYPYAEAKRDAEAIVAAAGVGHTIVRPTMVFGPGSPVQEGLERLALGGAPLVLGPGDVQLQPIDVEDLAAFLVALAGDHEATAPGASPASLEIGGGERLTLRALLARMRLAHTRAPRDPWGVPIGLLRRTLGLAESMLGLRLPVTAGQLASFVNDGVATPHPLARRLLPAPRPLTRSLLPAAPEASGGPTRAPTLTADAASRTPDALDAPEALAREFAVWSHYLGTAAPPARATAAYVRAHAGVAASPGDAVDGMLVRMARRSPGWCALADSYARRARPYGTLRRKLVLALAVLESTPVVHAGYDTARAGSRPWTWGALVALGVSWGVRTAAALVLFAPLHLAARRGRSPG